MNLESTKITLDKSSEKVYNFLTNVKNFKKIMPESINKFKLISDYEFIFALNGMPEISLFKKSEIPNESITLESAGKLNFYLKVLITYLEPEKSQIQLFFSGEFNPMMAMMIKGPIVKFIEKLISNIKKKV